MGRVKSKINRQRRAGTLGPKDYDHEIDLMDREASEPQCQDQLNIKNHADVSRSSSHAELLQHRGGDTPDGYQTMNSPRTNKPNHRQTSNIPPDEEGEPHDVLRPTISVQEASPGVFHDPNVHPKRPRVERETVIDVLYENERGGFLCGVPLFSAAALGGLDATPWTNAYHNHSPTSIYTATVPDPSWEWVWPEWRINYQEGVDEGGWEYSFAFSKKFSWHGPKWWCSFVRRRAWIRKRAKKHAEDIPADLHMLNADYFVVRSASARTKHSRSSVVSSRAPSQAPSMSQVSSGSAEPMELPEIRNIETLIRILRRARIDREKLEACENYLENGLDLDQLSEEMHNIMWIFIFQVSRRLFLSRLMQIYQSTKDKLEKSGKNNAEDGLEDRLEALRKAVKHADEEVRRLSYWSDVKQMTGKNTCHGGEQRMEARRMGGHRPKRSR